MKGWRKALLWGLVGLALLTGAGCARHAISKSLRQQADATVLFAALQANPAAYRDRLVIVGGTIVRTDLIEQSAVVTVAQHPLDRHERPRLTDETAGRFIAQCDPYIDPAVYALGRYVTVAGRVLGSPPGGLWGLAVGESDQETCQRMLMDLTSSGGRRP